MNQVHYFVLKERRLDWFPQRPVGASLGLCVLLSVFAWLMARGKTW